MRALVVDPSAPARLRLTEVPDPIPGPDQCLIQVEAVSLNRGELPEISGAPAGRVPGWDAAGTVIMAAANGTGPAVGTRVVTCQQSGGAWAERHAVDVGQLAVLPDGVDIAVASTLPVAAVSALRALRMVGGILGRRVLITGASGGVGRFAVQLAHQAGAYVIASVGSEARKDGLAALGADEVVVGLNGITAPIYAVLDNVGGPTLVSAFQNLEVDGTLVSIGYASLEPAAFPPYGTVGPLRKLVSFFVFTLGQVGTDLEYLVSLLQTHSLDPQIGWQGSWEQAAEAIQLLLDRKVNGKVVLRMD
jgi:NADPH:quinone reductase